MTASEIIRHLPFLSEAERRSVKEKLLELANENEDVSLCNQTASDGAVMLDCIESNKF